MPTKQQPQPTSEDLRQIAEGAIELVTLDERLSVQERLDSLRDLKLTIQILEDGLHEMEFDVGGEG